MLLFTSPQGLLQTSHDVDSTLQSAWSKSLIISILWALVSTGINVEHECTVQQNIKNKQKKKIVDKKTFYKNAFI